MRRTLRGIAAAIGLTVAAPLLACHSASVPIAAPAKSSFDADRVARGARLALIGDCRTCHTPAGGRDFSGGRPLRTPFGTIYGTNITPDAETGVGTWSEATFRRAMRDGVDRAGRNLYPAFPYDHFTKLTGDDIGALYAFLMTREPVRAETPPNELPFPYDLRPLLSGWKLLFLEEGVFRPDPSKDDSWNRGAYLAEALGHCGACHTPRNRLGAEIADKHFDGGEAEGWWAPPLNAASPAPVPWTADSLFAYLRSWEPRHGGAVGPMASVVANLARAPEADVRAIAVYVASQMGPSTPERRQRAEAPRAAAADAGGAAIYEGACAVCHESGGEVPFTVRSLAQHTAMAAPDPRNVIRVILEGVRPPEGEAGPIMPAFAGALTDRQVVELVSYLRTRFSDRPAWSGIEEQVGRIRGGGTG